ncbi:hypothetical protein J7432_07860 [Xanthomonas axonopodis pv. begoniae]|uniref:hypothetical protein n=1 Tax=Xanthomonas phaseoli TaxID=1985254 RepID=UPI001B1719B6|nr:hypothetical protein [Xanthomonas phaseoli]MBO9738945.1 hypothetical protein [Xanthomonas axonopodis pv. begoniae]MBO9770863.1 hypothetical protein [Xanthomonas axonopodis pv. begoniae]MCC8472062.1 hypothetical protein [Xanthomonas phaseoli]
MSGNAKVPIFGCTLHPHRAEQPQLTAAAIRPSVRLVATCSGMAAILHRPYHGLGPAMTMARRWPR